MKLLEAVARRWARYQHAEQLIFRGSLVTGIWIGRDKRPCDDIDFLATFAFDRTRLLKYLTEALAIDCNDQAWFDCDAISSETIFIDSDFPGFRLTVPAKIENRDTTEIQIDVGFNDPLPLEPTAIELKTDIDSFTILTPTPEVGFAWKLHGLVEKEGYTWRVKDLADLWLIAKNCSLDSDKLHLAIRTAFESRNGPVWRLDRWYAGETGKSRGSRKAWNNLHKTMPLAELPATIAEACEPVLDITEPHWTTLRTFPPIFPTSISQSEVQHAVSGSSNFEKYDLADGSVTFVYRHLSAKEFPEPLAAATGTEFRRRQILRELRGITFDCDGELIARPFPKFDTFNTNNLSILQGAEAYEKLDGSLVFPMKNHSRFTMRTRRGPSEIGDQAQRYLEQSPIDYQNFIQSCIENNLTPLFEWCSRQHRIIIDHPVDQLILTSIRDNISGVLLPRDQQIKLANADQIPIVASLGKIKDPKNWYTNVTNWKDREGCIVHIGNHQVIKIKSTHYKRLHQAIEGPNRDRARWQLFLADDTNSLIELSNCKGVDLRNYRKALYTSLNNYSDSIIAKLGNYPDRKSLATAAKKQTALERQIYFRLFQQTQPLPRLIEVIKTASDENLTRFYEVAKLINGPLLND